MFFSLKDNVSYEETGTKYKRDREYAGLWVSGDSFAGLPLYMQNKLVMIGNAKYLFSGILRWCWGLLWCWLCCGRGSGENGRQNGCGRKQMCLCCCIWCLQFFLWNQSLQGGCPFRCLSYNWDKLEETQ